MKTLNTLLTLSILVISSASFANTDDKRAEKNSNVPTAPSVWESSQIETPELLKFIKAKNVFVPITDFEWGNPSDLP